MRRPAIPLLGLLIASSMPLLAARAQVIELRSPNEEASGGYLTEGFTGYFKAKASGSKTV